MAAIEMRAGHCGLTGYPFALLLPPLFREYTCTKATPCNTFHIPYSISREEITYPKETVAVLVLFLANDDSAGGYRLSGEICTPSASPIDWHQLVAHSPGGLASFPLSRALNGHKHMLLQLHKGVWICWNAERCPKRACCYLLLIITLFTNACHVTQCQLMGFVEEARMRLILVSCARFEHSKTHR